MTWAHILASYLRLYLRKETGSAYSRWCFWAATQAGRAASQHGQQAWQGGVHTVLLGVVSCCRGCLQE